MRNSFIYSISQFIKCYYIITSFDPLNPVRYCFNVAGIRSIGETGWQHYEGTYKCPWRLFYAEKEIRS